MPLIAECQRQCIMTTEDDSSRSRRGKKGSGRVEGGGFGKEEEEGEFSSGKRRWGNGRQEGQEWGIVGTGRGKVGGRRKIRQRKDTCQQPLNVGTCASSVTRYLFVIVRFEMWCKLF